MPGDRLKKDHPEIQVWIFAWDRLFFFSQPLWQVSLLLLAREILPCVGQSISRKSFCFQRNWVEKKINFHPASLAAKMPLSRETWQILSIRQCFCSQGGWLKNICPKIQAKTQDSISVLTFFIQPPGTSQKVVACDLPCHLLSWFTGGSSREDCK